MTATSFVLGFLVAFVVLACLWYALALIVAADDVRMNTPKPPAVRTFPPRDETINHDQHQRERLHALIEIQRRPTDPHQPLVFPDVRSRRIH